MKLHTESVIFVCDSKCFHSMDWYHQVQEICPEKNVMFATDVIETDSTISLIKPNDKIVVLYDIYYLLRKKQSTISDIWRNLVKLGTTPLQIKALRKLAKEYSDVIFHAHSMYYIFLCWLARVKFIATPMGSDVLVRPDESGIYRYMTKKSLQAAYYITVDSVKMQHKIAELSGRNSEVIQNGIDVRSISSFVSDKINRKDIVSIRGFYPNYRIEKLMDAREKSCPTVNITFIYPFFEEGYKNEMKERMTPEDKDLGRLPKMELYKLLACTLLVVSIPESDSSPRSVYEAVFSGCCVAVSYSLWIDSLPACMRARLIVVELEYENWLDTAITKAKQITATPYTPSTEALIEYDQYESMKKVCRDIYKII